MELTKEDYKIIEEIMKTTEIIDNLYQKLYELDNCGEKNNDEYLKTLEYLKMTIEELENKQYNSLNISLTKGLKIVSYLYENFGQTIDTSNSILSGFDFNNRVLERVIKTVLGHSLENLPEIQSALESVFKNLPIDNNEVAPIIKDSLSSGTQINIAIEKDYKRLILILLDGELSKDKELLQAKYNFIFTNKDMEKELLYFNFNIEENLPSYLSTASLLMGIESSASSMINDYKLTDLFIMQVDSLLQIDDTMYNNSETVNRSKIISIIMRSLLTLMSEEQCYECNYNFHELLENKEYIRQHENNRKSEESIISVFKKIKSDKSKVITLYNN